MGSYQPQGTSTLRVACQWYKGEKDQLVRVTPFGSQIQPIRLKRKPEAKGEAPSNGGKCKTESLGRAIVSGDGAGQNGQEGRFIMIQLVAYWALTGSTFLGLRRPMFHSTDTNTESREARELLYDPSRGGHLSMKVYS